MTYRCQPGNFPNASTTLTKPVASNDQRDARRLAAVIFDVDGTLAETERSGHRVAFNRAFEEFRLDWHWSPEYYGQLLAVTGGKERLRLHVETAARDQLKRPDFERWIAELHHRKTEIYAELALSGAIVLRPGIARLIGELRAANVRLAIATTTTRACIDSLISAAFGCATSSLFEVVGAGDQVACKKPAPDIYQWVLQALDLPASTCLSIEDSAQGLAAARAAGIATLVTINPYTAKDDFPGALCVIDSLGDPERPARHIAGRQLSGTHVDLAQLRQWLASAQMTNDCDDHDGYNEHREPGSQAHPS